MRVTTTCLLFPLTLACLAPAQARQGADEAAFDAGLEAVHTTMHKGKWADANTALLALIAANDHKVYVQAQAEVLAADLATCAFYQQAKTPKITELLHGKISSLDERTGRIKISYDSVAADWEQQGELFVHPLVFVGGYSVTFAGRSYRQDDQGLSLAFDLDPTSDDFFLANFGGPNVLAAIGIGSGADVHWFVKEKSPATPGKPFSAALRIDDDSIELSIDRKSTVKGRRDKTRLGQVGVFATGWDSIALEGKVEPAWFQNRIDEELAKQRAEFDTSFDPKKRLPPWVFERPKVARTPPRSRSWLPGAERMSKNVEAAAIAFAEQRMADAQAALAKTGDGDGAPIARAFLAASLALHRGNVESAMSICEPQLAADAKSTPWRLLHAELLEALGRGDEGVTELAALSADDPGAQDVRESLCLAMLRRNQPDEAARVLRDAKVEHGMWDELSGLSTMLHMAERGPDWPRRHTYRSAHYEIVSDIDARVCFKASCILEVSYVNLMAQLTWVKEDKSMPRFRVFLFSGESGYQEYCSRILGAPLPHTAGMYSPVLKQLLIWNVARREDMERTIRHEGFHQFLDRLMPNPPTWLNEGIAEFWETAVRDGGRLVGGQPRPDHVATLARSRQALPKLVDFTYGGREEFYGSAQQRYAQAWAFVHFLRKGPKAYAQRFETLWDELRKQQSTRAALDKAFTGMDWEACERDFWKYVDDLR